jgi:hypothetical protein
MRKILLKGWDGDGDPEEVHRDEKKGVAACQAEQRLGTVIAARSCYGTYDRLD